MIRPIQTEYKECLFRSRLEARWAFFFDLMGIKWEYEPEGIILDNGTYYLPDFFLPDFHCFFEVKRAGIKGTNEGDTAEAKILDGDDWAGMICFGDPVDDDIMIHCQELDNQGGGNYEGAVTIGIHPETKKPFLFTTEWWRECEFFPSWPEYEVKIPMVTAEYGKYSYSDFVTRKVLSVRKLARQARFEHGEKPGERLVV